MSKEGGTISVPECGPVPAALAPGDLVDGQLRVERLLGEGGSGTVWLVRHQGLGGARFALKLLRAAPGRPLEALVREGRLAARVDSPHVVKVTGLGSLPGGTPFLLLEYVDGPTLESLLADRDLVTAEALECGRQLCLALEAAHAQGLVHGDLSLRNVFASPRPDGRHHFSLGDFGLARSVRREPGATVSAQPEGLRGTPRFIAPETIAGDSGGDQRSDLFSLGVLLYRLLCGAWPFDGASSREILAAVLRGGPRPPAAHRPGLGPLAPLVLHCLEPDPERRFQSARELREALDGAARSAPTPAAGSQAAPVAEGRRRRALTAALAAVALAAAAWPAVERALRARRPIPLGPSLECPDAAVPTAAGEPALGRAVAQGLCARLGARLDLDWGGGEQATVLATQLSRAPAGPWLLRAEVEGRSAEASGESPLAAAAALARHLSGKVLATPPDAEEVRRWGAASPETATAMREAWRRRTAMVIEDYAREPREVLARDPTSPFAHLMLFHVERDPVLGTLARTRLLGGLRLLPPDRAAALRGYVEVADGPESPHQGLEAIKRAFNTSPDDLDIGLVYALALQTAGQADTLAAVAGALHERAPRRALLAVHWATREAGLDEVAHLVEWELKALPELSCSTERVQLLLANGAAEEAEAGCAFAARLGVPLADRYIPGALLAMASGDPARVDESTVRALGYSNTWPQTVAAHLRTSGLLITGRVAAAGAALRTQLAGARAAGARARAVQLAAELLQVERRTGAPGLSSQELEWMEQELSWEGLRLQPRAFAACEFGLARARAGSPPSGPRRALATLEAELARRAGGDGVHLLRARLRTLPLVRRASGDEAAAALWRASLRAPLADRLLVAFDAALALEGAGASVEAEEALWAATRPYELESHALDSAAARLRLADRMLASGRGTAAAPLLDHLDRVWSRADPGLREALRALR